VSDPIPLPDLLRVIARVGSVGGAEHPLGVGWQPTLTTVRQGRVMARRDLRRTLFEVAVPCAGRPAVTRSGEAES
jgi:hypothetical protein